MYLPNTHNKSAKELATDTMLGELYVMLNSLYAEDPIKVKESISNKVIDTKTLLKTAATDTNSAPSSNTTIKSLAKPSIDPLSQPTSANIEPEVEDPILSPLAQLPISKSKPYSNTSNRPNTDLLKSHATFFTDDNESDQSKAETGRKGESFFYNILLKFAKRKFSKFEMINIENGFKVLNENREIILEVIWLNKINEQKKPRDIVVKYHGKEYIFEVKTTKSKQMHAFISRAEVEELKAKQDNYALVFVTDIDNDAQYYIQWNPNRKIQEGIIELIPIKYAIFVEEKDDDFAPRPDLGPEKPADYAECIMQ